MIGQISGMDGPARSLDRLAVSAERAAALVERLEAEVTVEYVLETLERLHRMADVIEEMNRSVQAIQATIDLAYSSRKRPRARNSSVSIAEHETPMRSAMER